MDERTGCAIAGGGPAGIVLGYLLARAGVDVVVLEKHADFFRDFRGDTIHPSTLEVMRELGLLERFLQLPHDEVREAEGYVGGTKIALADFTHLPTTCKFVAMMPQWDFLNFIAAEARRYAGFHLQVNAEVTDLVESDGRVAGLRFRTPDGPRELRADLVVAADGRSSVVRERAGLPLLDIGAPIDVLWLRVPRRSSDQGQLLGRIDRGQVLVMFDRGDYWQCAYVIRKGGVDAVHAAGLPAFRARLAALAPFLAGRLDELREWSDVKLLSVKVDRLRRWYRPGLVCIGDAAHAMSPIGGVGVNLAVQDAVAAANMLWRPLRAGRVGVRRLAALQRRRALPAALTQRVQVFLHRRVLERVLGATDGVQPPFVARLFTAVPFLRRVPAYAVGVGVRPEHVRSPAAAPP